MGSNPKKQRSKIRLLQRRAKKASVFLHNQYGSPRHGNKQDPLDELVFIILSLMTTYHSFNRVYSKLKSRIGNWDALLTIRLSRLRNLIKDGGLSDQKAKRLIGIMKRIKQDFNSVTLVPLRRMADPQAEAYLTSLPGVGIKTAKCILMYSLGREVLPVDTHVWRIAVRLGLVGEEVTYSSIHEALEEVVLPEDRYSFHVNAIVHGRKVCTALRPKCADCQLRRICNYSKKAHPFLRD